MKRNMKLVSEKYPVAIGGLGGSGTRAVADVLRSIGYYIGDDLNISNDNLWFTIIFKKLSIMSAPELSFAQLVDQFFERMESGPSGSLSSLEMLMKDELRDSESDWLAERYSSFVSQKSTRDHDQPWGWKEPNTHIFIERLLNLKPDLVYMHVSRNPFYMAYSQNQNQLRMWGSTIMGCPIEITPRFAMKFWCAMHRRIHSVATAFPDRVTFIDYDDMCESPEKTVISMAKYLGIRSLPIAASEIAKCIERQPLFPPQKQFELSDFDDQDLSYVLKQGFEIPI
jgi:Sulfotransferase family